MDKHRHGILSPPVIVGALGFFVDVYDLLLYNIIRKSLRTLTGNFVSGGWMTGVIIMTIAFVAAWLTRESFGKDMNFLEQ
jgi:hypothetical protein